MGVDWFVTAADCAAEEEDDAAWQLEQLSETPRGLPWQFGLRGLLWAAKAQRSLGNVVVYGMMFEVRLVMGARWKAGVQ